jgi:hypothetical protein
MKNVTTFQKMNSHAYSFTVIVADIVGPFPDMHTIIHFEADTITYKEPTIPIELNHHPRKEPSTLHVYCIYHQDSVLFNTDNIQQLLPILHILNILNAHTQEAQPTPPHTQVNHIPQWNILLYPSLLPLTMAPPPLPYYIPLNTAITLMAPLCPLNNKTTVFGPKKLLIMVFLILSKI